MFSIPKMAGSSSLNWICARPWRMLAFTVSACRLNHWLSRSVSRLNSLMLWMARAVSMKLEFSCASGLDGSFAQVAEPAVSHQPQDEIQQQGDQHDQREPGAVDEDHRQCRHAP